MKKIITSFALALTSLCLSAEDLSFRGQTDKDPLLYKLGEEIVFRVTLVDKAKKSAPVKGRKLVWERTGDDGKKEKGEALSDEPLVVKTKIDIPGFVRVIVNVLDEKGKKVPGSFAQFDGNAIIAVNTLVDERGGVNRDMHLLANSAYCTNMICMIVRYEHAHDFGEIHSHILQEMVDGAGRDTCIYQDTFLESTKKIAVSTTTRCQTAEYKISFLHN